MNEKAHELGRRYSPRVSHFVGWHKESDRWFASVSMGDYYYETDRYKDKDGAVSELLGCLEALKEKIEQVINKLK